MKIKQAIDCLGSRAAVAKAAGVSRQYAQYWVRVPEKFTEKVMNAMYKKRKEQQRVLETINKMIGQLEAENETEQNQRSD